MQELNNLTELSDYGRASRSFNQYSWIMFLAPFFIHFSGNWILHPVFKFCPCFLCHLFVRIEFDYFILAEGPVVARGKKIEKKIFEKKI